MHVRRALALSLLTPLLLAGCSDGGEPEADPTPKMPETSSTTPSPSETETVEEESPEEFIRRWQKAALVAQNSGDTKAYRKFGPKCDPCLDFAKNVDEIYERGGSVRLENLRVLAVQPAKGAYQYRLVRVLGKTQVLDANGREEQGFDGGREVLMVYLEKSGSEWTVRTFLRT